MRFHPVQWFALAVLLLICAPAEAARRPDPDTRYTFDLSRGDAPLMMSLDLHEGMWQFGDHRTIGRLKSDAAHTTSWLYSRDTGAAGWYAQAHLEIYDLQQSGDAPGEMPTIKGSHGRRKTAPAAFRAYIDALPKRYEAADMRVAIKPHLPRATRELRAGRERIPLWFTDMGITRKPGSKSPRDYRVTVFGFVVRDRLVTLRVRQVERDLASLFVDGLSLSTRPRGAIREVKFTTITANRTETRATLRLPKDFDRVLPGAPGSSPRDRMGEWTRTKDGQRTGRLTLDVMSNTFEPARDLEGWKARNPWAKAGFERRKPRGKRIEHVYAQGAAQLNGRPATRHAAIWYVGPKRYELRLDVLQPKGVAKPLGRKQMEAMIRTVRAWETRASTR